MSLSGYSPRGYPVWERAPRWYPVMVSQEFVNIFDWAQYGSLLSQRTDEIDEPLFAENRSAAISPREQYMSAFSLFVVLVMVTAEQA